MSGVFTKDQEKLISAMITNQMVKGSIFALIAGGGIGWVASSYVPLKKENDISNAIGNAVEASKNAQSAAENANSVVTTIAEGARVDGWPAAIVCNKESVDGSTVYSLLHSVALGTPGTTTYAIIPPTDSVKSRLIYFDASTGKLSGYRPADPNALHGGLEGCAKNGSIQEIIEDGRGLGYLKVTTGEQR